MNFLWSLPYFVFAVAAHAILGRFHGPAGVPTPTRSRLSKALENSVFRFLIAGVPLGLLLCVQLALTSGMTIATTAGVVAYAGLCELYLFLFTMVSSSISARLLLLLRSGALSERQIDDRIESTDLVAGRIQRMRGTGLLVEDEASLRPTPAGRRLVASYRILRRVFGFEVKPAKARAPQTPVMAKAETKDEPVETNVSTPKSEELDSKPPLWQRLKRIKLRRART